MAEELISSESIIPVKSNDGISAISSVTYTRQRFLEWLSSGIKRKYSPAILITGFDRASNYALKKKLSTVDLWEIEEFCEFAPIYNKLMAARLFQTIENSTYKIFAVAGQQYMRFLKEKPFTKETAEAMIVSTLHSTEPVIERLFTKKADWSLFNYGFAIPQRFVAAFFIAIGTELNSSNTKAKITLTFNGKKYQSFAVAYGKVIQVRWSVNDNIALELRRAFSKCYEDLKEIKTQGISDLLPEHNVFLDIMSSSVCGELALVEHMHSKTVALGTEPTGETFADNRDFSLIAPQRSEINPKDVAVWLVTQPNANGSLYLENVATQYMSTLRAAPAKFDISEAVNRNVFNCHTTKELKALWNTFLAAPNYKQVNASTSGVFSAGMKCLYRYLESLSNENVNGRMQNQEKTRENENLSKIHTSPDKILNLSIIGKLTKILTERFSNGFRIASPIELARFRAFASADLGEDISLLDEELKNHISACGNLFEGKIYTVSDQTKARIKALAVTYFESGAKAIFFEEFYRKHENWLFGSNVISENMLIGILRGIFPSQTFTRTYFGFADVSVIQAIDNEVIRVWGDDALMTYEQLAERLLYIPLERIKYSLSLNGDFVWNSAETYCFISRFSITDEEYSSIREAAERECRNRGYVSIAELPFGDIAERNYELSITAVQNAVNRVCLSDKFDKKGKIVTRKGDVFDALTIIKEHCRNIDKCSLDDLLNLEKELTGEVHRWIPMEAGNAVLVRIDKNTYVADKCVHFDTCMIDEAIAKFVKGDYLPLKVFTTFGAFPDCGQIWNLFLLESYCRRFSRMFRFGTSSVNSRNAGAVIRKSCGMDYTEIMADAVANSDIPLESAAVGCFLFDNGYTGRSTTAKASEIIDKAKAIREGRD